MKLFSYIHDCPCSNTICDTEPDHTRLGTNTIVGIIVLVIWFLKLKAYTNLLLTSTSFSTLSDAITSLTTVIERFYIDLNLSRRQILTFKTNVNEDITNALWIAHF